MDKFNEIGEQLLVYMLFVVAGFMFCHNTHAEEYDRGAELLERMKVEMKTDRVASRQDKRMNRSRGSIEVRWDINADFEITSGPKYRLHISNQEISYETLQQLREAL